MVLCKFSGSSATTEVRAEALYLRGGAMYADSDGQPFAVHSASRWQFAHQHFARFDVEGPLNILLVRGPGHPGRVLSQPRAWFADGVLHTPAGHLVCLHEDTNTWLEVPSCTHYTEIAITSASPRTAIV